MTQRDVTRIGPQAVSVEGAKYTMTRRFLNNFFSCHSKIDILRTIIQSDKPQSGRQIAAKAGLSPRSCQLSLDELVKLKALERTASGKAYYYSVNLDNQIVTDLIIPIVQQEERLTNSVVDSLRSKFGRKSKKGIRGVYFLETWPRTWGGKGDSARLMAVLSNNSAPAELEKNLSETVEMMLRTYGMPANYVILSSEDFSDLVHGKPRELEILQKRLQNVSGDNFDVLVQEEKGHPEHIEKAVDFFPKGRKRSAR